MTHVLDETWYSREKITLQASILVERYTRSIFPTKNSNRKGGIDIKTKTNNNKQSRDRNQNLKTRKRGGGGPGATPAPVFSGLDTEAAELCNRCEQSTSPKRNPLFLGRDSARLPLPCRVWGQSPILLNFFFLLLFPALPWTGSSCEAATFFHQRAWQPFRRLNSEESVASDWWSVQRGPVVQRVCGGMPATLLS